MKPFRPRALAGCAALVALALSLPAGAAAAPVPLAQIGSNGAGAGQLAFPHAVVVAPSGDLYVADRDNNRISVFSPSGGFIRAFGVGVASGGSSFEVCTTSCQAGLGGTGAGDLSQPEGVALDGSGNLYVSDFNNHRINVYGIAGPSFVRAFGAGVDTAATSFESCTAASGCEAGEGTAVAGAMSFPSGLALDGSGNLYVSDTNNHRIDVFNTAGPTFVRAFGAGVDTPASNFETCTTLSGCEIGEATAVAGAVKFPTGLALDGAGNLYVSESQNHRISAFSTAGPTFTRAFGFSVAGGGVFESCTSPCQIGVAGAQAGQFNAPQGIALDSSGSLQVVDFNNRVATFDPTVPSFIRAFGWDVALPDDGPAFEVCPTDGDCKGADSGTGFGQLWDPHGVAADCQGAIWVADSENSRLERFGEPGTPLCQPAGPGGGGGGVTTPTAPAAPAATPTTPRKKCKKGFVKKKVKGKVKCVKKRK
jgi:DNA-binding beta-propeller fold protein YncE